MRYIEGFFRLEPERIKKKYKEQFIFIMFYFMLFCDYFLVQMFSVVIENVDLVGWKEGHLLTISAYNVSV
jgi:hypothetical protein